MKKRFLKMILVVMFMVLGITNVKAENRTLCTYTVDNKNFDLIITSTGNYNIQYTSSNFENVTSGESNNIIYNYTANTCPIITYKSQSSTSLLIYVNSLSCSGNCYSLNPSSMQIINYNPTTPVDDSITPRKRKCSYLAGSQEIILTFDSTNRLIDKNIEDSSNYLLQNIKSDLIIKGNAGSCPQNGIYYYMTNRGNPRYICLSINDKVECSSNATHTDWKKLSFNGEITGTNEDGSPIYSGIDYDYNEITNEGAMSCEELIGTKGIKLLRAAFLLMKIAAPIIFIALSMLDFTSALTSDNPESERNKAFRNMVIRAIACVLLFMLPLIIKIIFSIVGVIDTDTCGIW